MTWSTTVRLDLHFPFRYKQLIVAPIHVELHSADFSASFSCSTSPSTYPCLSMSWSPVLGIHPFMCLTALQQAWLWMHSVRYVHISDSIRKCTIECEILVYFVWYCNFILMGFILCERLLVSCLCDVQRSDPSSGGAPSMPPPPSMRDCILLAACGAYETLPQNSELPADVFTACLTTPIKIALRW